MLHAVRVEEPIRGPQTLSRFADLLNLVAVKFESRGLRDCNLVPLRPAGLEQPVDADAQSVLDGALVVVEDV